ncbi:DUF1963 domain-containing protein [Leisingera sp. XS_AS12]|uniref:DUF1963 domain-containing protein n=1 Tax=Leisingera sp. XS_AS12 TaxID=3241294 RepID=UPI003519B9EF
MPCLEEGREWPLYMDEPMAFILQLDLASLPVIPGLPRHGLLSYFRGEDFEEDQSNIALILQDTSKAGAPRQWPEGLEFTPSPRPVTGWRELTETLHIEDLVELDLDGDPRDFPAMPRSEIAGTVRTSDGKTIPEAEAIATGATVRMHTFRTDKLGGHPYWDQGPERPDVDDAILLYQVSDQVKPGIGTDILEDPACTIYGTAHIWYSPKNGRFYHDWA